MNIPKIFLLIATFVSFSILAINEDEFVYGKNVLPFPSFIDFLHVGQKVPMKIISVSKKENSLEVIIMMAFSDDDVVEREFIFNEKKEIEIVQKVLMGKDSPKECYNQLSDHDNPLGIFLIWSPGYYEFLSSRNECVFETRNELNHYIGIN